MGKIINVKEIVEKRKKELYSEIIQLKAKGIVPKLAVILASGDDASRIYVSKKRNLCKEMEVEEREYIFESHVTQEEIEKTIEELNSDNSIHGILVQVPLYNHLDEKRILEKIYPEKDVDGFHPVNIGKLVQGTNTVMPCTTRGILSILKESGVELEGKHAVVVGRSVIVGKPTAAALLNEGCTVTICHSKTKHLSRYTLDADILIVAVGKHNLVNKNMVKDKAVVIDVGINRIDGKVYGDVDTASVSEIAGFVTPVPGGVGVTTVLSLLENLILIINERLK